MSTVEEVKDRLDIVDIVSETVQLRRAGKNHTGFCPFHNNTRTPAFVVFPETGTWRCFGQCAEGGDVFKFVMKREGWDFPEALRHLADRAGVVLRTPSPQEKAAKEQHSELRALLENAVTFFRHQLMNTEAGGEVLNYLTDRGLSDESIDAFDIGYAPDDWDLLSKHFQAEGHSVEQLKDAGLISENDSGKVFDRFRHRAIFPIRDNRGRMAGFGARALRADESAKYLNSPQTALFDKGRLLYGHHMARKAIRAQDQAVIVEGYMDVIALHQAGFANAVSPMGTALTEQQLRLLKRLTRRIVLALDADAAGNKATLRGLDVARRTMDRETELVFNPRGLLRHEARLQADIRVSTLPEGLDPDEVVQKDPGQWPMLLEAARPVVEHVMLSLAEDKDLDDPKTKTEIASQVMPLIADLPSAIERDSYIQKLARLLKVDERSLMSERPTKTRRRPYRRAVVDSTEEKKKKPSLINDSHFKLEAHCLSIIIRHPELIYRVDRELQEHSLPRLSSNDFEHSDLQEMFRLSLDSLAQDSLEPASFALENLPLPLIDRAYDLLNTSKSLDPNEERVFEDLLRTILLLRRRNLHQTNEQMRFLQEGAQEDGDLRASEYQQVMVKNTQAMQRLDIALGKFTSRAFSAAK
jgi:DNA primase